MKKILSTRYYWKNSKIKNQVPQDIKVARDAFLEKHKSSKMFETQSCFICGSKKFIALAEVDRYGFYYPTGICEDCGNVQQVEYYSKEVLLDFYKNYYRLIYSGGVKNSKEMFVSQQSKGRKIYEFIQPFYPSKVLEIGCAAGGILSIFKDHGCEVLGLDYDEDYLDVARNNGVNVQNGSIEVLRGNDKYDLIILSHVLEHMVSPVKVLSQVTRHLTPTGAIYIEVPSLNNVSDGGYGFDLLQFFQNAHTIHFTKSTLDMLSKKSGLTCLKMDSFIRSLWRAGPIIQPTKDDMSKCLKENIALLNKIEFRRRALKAGVNFLSLIGMKSLFKFIYLKIVSFK
jgi:2-polyprenyl-3-methyl-5-hydroxy-6-metoxy-1,4-benzoquinol methylase